jgi:hypothetical protein
MLRFTIPPKMRVQKMKISVLLREFQFGTEFYKFETYTKKIFRVSAV